MPRPHTSEQCPYSHWAFILNKLYNWIKFKSLPPSVGFKNRLFIERDNKHRRVVFNLGLTFRNSKWADYSRSNLSASSVTNFKTLLKYTLFIITSVLTLFCACKYFLYLDAAQKAAMPLWFLMDSTIYTKAILFATWVVSFQHVVDALYSKFLRGLSDLVPTSEREVIVKDLRTAKVDRRTRYIWSLYGKSSSHKAVTDLYEGESRPTGGIFSRIYRALYRFTHWLELYREVVVVREKPKVKKMDALEAFLADLRKLDGVEGTAAVFHDHLHRDDGKPKGRRSPSLWALETQDAWTPKSIEEAEAWRKKGQAQGAFSVPSTSFSEVNSTSSDVDELSFLDEAATDQTVAAKWSRWLYKYNLLHRKFLLSSHKNTLTKRLLGSGFYDSSFFTKNVHSQSITSNHANPSEFFKGSFLETYANFLFRSGAENSSTGTNPRWLQLNYAPQISFNELSYLWFTKRFYLFNTLPSLSRVNSPRLNTTNVGTVFKSSNLTPTISEFQLLQQNELKYFDVLRSLDYKESMKTQPSNQNLALGSGLSLTNDVSDLFDYDFTDTAVILFANPISEKKETFYFSNFSSGTSNY